MADDVKSVLDNRPMPPDNLGEFVGSYPVIIAVDHVLPLFVKNTLLNNESPLHNPDHDHLLDHLDNGAIGFLWAAPEYIKNCMQVLGTCEQLQFRAGGWQKARMEQQFMEWFGVNYPDYIITLSAGYCQSCTPMQYMALIDHELYHIAQANDSFGAPKFNRDNGLPSLTIKAHDVEEFNGIVRRYGLSEDMKEMFEYANMQPELGEYT